MMKLTKKWAILLCALLPMTMMAQDKKSFTLDDLMWGGSNYYNIMPRSIEVVDVAECLDHSKLGVPVDYCGNACRYNLRWLNEHYLVFPFLIHDYSPVSQPVAQVTCLQ